MILQPSDAQNSSFLHFFWSFKKYTQKVMPKDAGICVRKGHLGKKLYSLGKVRIYQYFFLIVGFGECPDIAIFWL